MIHSASLATSHLSRAFPRFPALCRAFPRLRMATCQSLEICSDNHMENASFQECIDLVSLLIRLEARYWFFSFFLLEDHKTSFKPLQSQISVVTPLKLLLHLIQSYRGFCYRNKVQHHLQTVTGKRTSWSRDKPSQSKE